MSVRIDGRGLTLEEVVRVARAREAVEIGPEVASRMRASRAVVEEAMASGTPVYGVNTGFGELKNRHIDAAHLGELQRNLLRSHAAGVGDSMPTDTVRAMGLLRAESLAIGVSGVREEVVRALIALLNTGVHPVVPEQGSVGASGDLAPLAHYALVLVGEGEAEYQGHRLPGSEALARAGLAPLALEAKEGLGLINGTQQSTAYLALALADAELVIEATVAAASMSLEALLGSVSPMHERVTRARRQPGAGWAARQVRLLTRESALMRSHEECDRIQDPYSLRCIPQVVGATLDALEFSLSVLERELESATDNPLVFADASPSEPWHERILSAGNFHAQPVALAADVAAIGLATLASQSERRLHLLTDESRSGLNAFLARDPGLHSGLMLVQYTAAALVSENKGLAHPASVDSIPTSAGMEDHVSMAPWAGRKLARVVTNARRVAAAEFLCAAQALDLRAPLEPGRGTGALHRAVRRLVPTLAGDRPPAPDLAALDAWIAAGGVRATLAEAGEPIENPWRRRANGVAALP
ncbi:MAG TPA: histidine ammonia-lyase [Candidatus Eisenbacteria bacterium]|nr:histidine ammonia-lyase [Candidatus Eisenbacteria bacterium]